MPYSSDMVSECGTPPPEEDEDQLALKWHSLPLNPTPPVVGAWETELSRRIYIYGKTVDDFIDTLLPSSTPYTLDDDLHATFDKYTSGTRKGHLQCDNLVSGFTKLVEPFPTANRLTFANTFKRQLNFPFNEFATDYHLTAPDISVSFPGEPLGPASWQRISMVIECKSLGQQDPFVDPFIRYKRTPTIDQLAKNARNLMLAHGFLAAFVVGIYGDIVQLVRFDRTCALISRKFDIKGPDGARLLQKFFWHFTHPVVGDTVVGCDPTVMKLDAKSQAWVKHELQRVKAKEWENHVKELAKGRRVEVYDEKTGRCVPYLLYQVLSVSGQLFSRATMVWRAIEDTRIWQDGRLVPDSSRTTSVKPRILKEAWRQLVRPAEAKFYQRLNANNPEEEWYGLARMECGGDLGEFELRWWDATQRRRAEGAQDAKSKSDSDTLSPGPSRPSASSRLFSSTGSAGTPQASSAPAPENYVPTQDFPLRYPQHQTYSWRLVKDGKNWHRDRSHIRIVIDDVGRPLTRFKNTLELVCAVRDAIRGHKLAWEKARILHRDVSVGNILIADQSTGESAFTGFLHDYDYSIMGPDPTQSCDEKPSAAEVPPAAPAGADTTQPGSTTTDESAYYPERAGTYHFLAVQLLKSSPGVIMHKTCHDLESFYWVLLWVIVRHTEHRHPWGDNLYNRIFSFGHGEDVSAGAKRGWVTHEEAVINIPTNNPLTHLLDKLVWLVLDHIPVRGRLRVPLEYEPMLRLFDEAIAMPGWPEDDWRPCALDGEQGIGIAPVDDSDSAQKRKADSATTPGNLEPAHTGSETEQQQCTSDPLNPPPPPPSQPSPQCSPAVVQKNRSNLKRSFDIAIEEHLDSESQGASTSEPRKDGRTKRQKTNSMVPLSPALAPASRSQSQDAGTSSKAGLRRSVRIHNRTRKLANGEALK